MRFWVDEQTYCDTVASGIEARYGTIKVIQFGDVEYEVIEQFKNGAILAKGPNAMLCVIDPYLPAESVVYVSLEKYREIANSGDPYSTLMIREVK
jgi:hypothetical protein